MTGPILFIDNHQISSVEVDGTLIGQLQVTATGSLATTDTAVTVGSAVNVQVDGGVYSEVDAIYGSSADDTTIIVGAFGTVRGFDGVYLGGSGNSVINNGGISGSLSVKDCAAIKLDSSENYLLNTGYLTGYYGIFATGLVSPADQNLIVNSGTIQASAVGIRLVEDHSFGPSSPSKSMALSDYGVFTSGSIIAGEVGIEITHAGHVKNTGLVQAGDIGIGYTSGETSLFNSGTIVGHIAYYGSSGGDSVINQGRMQGEIFLNEDNDLYDGRFGFATGPIDLGSGDDTAYGGDGVETIFGDIGNDLISGGGGNDTLAGGQGRDTLDGGQGADRMVGGLDDDTFIVDSDDDLVLEEVGEGIDTVKTALTHILEENVENLVLTGTGSVNGTGNESKNTITGNAGDNVLDGGAGADTMFGGRGNDTYIVDDADDQVGEAFDSGTDTVRSSVTYALTSNVENLVLTGMGSTSGTGNDFGNTITGNAAENVLDGGGGADTLVGGDGNDTYIVDSTGDLIVESGGNGIDNVQASVSYALAANVENLTLVGAGNSNGTGNNLDNNLAGNAGNNVLDGGTGADQMAGGLGNDTYLVDDENDLVIEAANQGTDTVRASVSYTLAANVEKLVLTGTADLDGVGNALGNALTGNSGANVLTGGAGNDTIDGGAGIDRAIFSGLHTDYVVTRQGDGSVVVLDTRFNQDGTDVLRNIEILQFQDGDVSLPSHAPGAPIVQSVNIIDENAAPNTNVGTIRAPGFAPGEVAFSLASNPGGKFAIDATTGLITLVGSVNYEAAQTTDLDLQIEMVGNPPQERRFYVVAVKATETVSNWSSGQTLIKVYVNDVNEAPTGLSFTDGTAKASISETALDGTVVGILQAADPDGDTQLVYSFDTSGHGGTSGNGNAGGRFKIENGQLKVAALSDVTKTETYTVTLKVTDKNGGPGATSTYKDFLITVEPGTANTAPTSPALQGPVAELDENGSVTPVATVNASDDGFGGTVVQYELVTNPGGLFSIDPASGVISFVGGANYEAGDIGLLRENPGPNERKYFNVVVRAVESGNGLASNATTIKVYLNDLNEGPTGATYAVNPLSEKAQAGDTVATLVSVSDPDARAAFRTFSYSLVNADGSAYAGTTFAVDANGKVTLAGALPDISVQTIVPVFVRITDQTDATLTTTKQLDVTVYPVTETNTAPLSPVTQGAVVELTENAANVVNVATIHASDDGVGGTSVQYEIVSNPGGLFSIDAATGVLSFTGGPADYESTITGLQTENAGQTSERKFFNVEVLAHETGVGGLTSGTTIVKVYLNDVNEAPTDLSYTVIALGTAAPQGATVATLQSAADPDAVNANRDLRYQLVNVDHNAYTGTNFTIDAVTGEIKIGAGGLPSVSAVTDVALYVKVTDQGGSGLSYVEQVLVHVDPGQANTAPTNPTMAAHVDERSGDNTLVATLDDKDDDGQTISYTFQTGGTTSADGKYKIVGNTIVTVGAVASVDHDTPTGYSVVANDGSGAANNTATGTVTITIREIDPPNGAPTIGVTGGTSFTATNQGAVDPFGGVTISDDEAADALTLTIKYRTGDGTLIGLNGVTVPTLVPSGADSTFTFTGTKVQLNGILHNLQFDPSDREPGGAPVTTALMLSVTDIAHPTAATPTSITVVSTPPGSVAGNNPPSDITLALTNGDPTEYVAAGTLVGSLSTTDQDAGDTFQYQLVDNAGGRFKLVNGNQLVVDNGFLFDYEQAKSHAIKVHVEDGHGGSFDKTITIGVHDVNPEKTFGSAGNDVFFGGALNDTLSGGVGNDRLMGGLGKDTLKGEAGNDTIGGGDGNDKLYGGTGRTSKDLFVFDTKLSSAKIATKAKDVIYDFGPKYDTLGFEDGVFTNRTISNFIKAKHGATLDHKVKMDRKFIAFGDHALDRDDFFVYNQANGKLYWDVDGSGAKAQVEIATIKLEKKAGLITASDFYFV